MPSDHALPKIMHAPRVHYFNETWTEPGINAPEHMKSTSFVTNIANHDLAICLEHISNTFVIEFFV